MDVHASGESPAKIAYRALTCTEPGGYTVGRDPRKITVAEYAEVGIVPRPMRAVIREKCLDCCVGQQSEVARCTATGCALWPYRMNANPFRNVKITEDQRADRAARARMLSAYRA